MFILGVIIAHFLIGYFSQLLVLNVLSSLINQLIVLLFSTY